MCYEEYEVPFALNHITYRGYYRDDETGLYYLQSRYYDAGICRFINADDVSYLGKSGTIWSYNLYSYCDSNPVNAIDPYGKLALELLSYEFLLLCLLLIALLVAFYSLNEIVKSFIDYCITTGNNMEIIANTVVSGREAICNYYNYNNYFINNCM